MYYLKSFKIATVCVVGLGLTAGFASAQEGNNTIATVNGEKITESMLNAAESQIGQSFGQMPEDQKRQVLIDVLVDLLLLAQQARKDGIENTEEYKQRLEFLKIQSLRDEYFNKNVIDLVSDEEIKARYEQESADTENELEVDASHILVETEVEAIEIITLLDEGGDFAELAKEKSTGPSGPNGGQLGYFGKGRMVKPFETAAFELEIDSYTKEPVETQFGWHVIKVNDRRQKPAPPFEQIEPQIRQSIIREKYEGIISGLKASAEIVIEGEAE